jgi:hypothetical protein
MLAVDMIVAYIVADRGALLSLFRDQDVAKFASAAEFWFLFGSALVLALGPGWFSIDALIKAMLPSKRRQAAGLPEQHG